MHPLIDLHVLEALIDAAADGVVVVDPEGTHLLVNRAFSEMSGFDAEELIGTKTPHPYWAPEAMEEILGAWGSTSSGQPESYALTFRRKNEERFEASVRPSFVTADGQQYCIATVRDLTREREDAARLEEADHLIEALCVGGYLAWWSWNLNDGTSKVSDSYYQQNGYEVGAWEPSYEAWASRVHPEDVGLADEQTHLLLTGEIPVLVSEHRFLQADGSWSWTLSRGFVMERNADGSPRFVMGIQQNIDDRRAAEEKLRELEKMQVVGQTAGGVAHDFNNLLTVIQSNLELLSLDFHLTDSEAAQEIGAAVARGAALTRSLLEYSRPASKKKELVDVPAALEGIRGFLVSLLADRARLRWSVSEGRPLQVELPLSEIERCVTNLVANARDAMESAGGCIEVLAREETISAEDAARVGVRPGRHVLITVADDGPGMKPELVERCTEPMFTTKPRGEGTGLGLSVVSRVAKAAGGALSVESTVGEGTTVRLFLPATHGPEPGVLTRGGGASEVPQDLHGTEHLLVVDDEPAVARALASSLGDLGYQVRWSDNPRAALSLIEGQETDLLLTDINMPFTINGVELARRGLEQRPEMKVVFISALPEEHHENGLRNYGVLVEKPFTLEELARSIRAALPG